MSDQGDMSSDPSSVDPTVNLPSVNRIWREQPKLLPSKPHEVDATTNQRLRSQSIHDEIKNRLYDFVAHHLALGM